MCVSNSERTWSRSSLSRVFGGPIRAALCGYIDIVEDRAVAGARASRSGRVGGNRGRETVGRRCLGWSTREARVLLSQDEDATAAIGRVGRMESDDDGETATKNLRVLSLAPAFRTGKRKTGPPWHWGRTGRMSSSPELDCIDGRILPMDGDGGWGGVGGRERNGWKGGGRKGGVGDCEANDRNEQEAWGARAT